MHEACATKSVNKFFRGIFSQDVFIPSAVGVELADCLKYFVRSYMYQASEANKLALDYFQLIPKLHWCHHIAHEMKRQCDLAGYCLNPAIHSCSMDEDFIGKMAALSRCVSPRLVSKRVMERYLAHIQHSWHQR